jgi:indole-3-glycerol phosphate synthase
MLDEIVAHKRREVAERKELYPAKLLEKSVYFATPCVSLTTYLRRSDKVSIIAEIKRRSPSKGIFKHALSVEELSIGYMQAGASALSVLTDTKYFGGANEDLVTARRFNFCPILRKDFTVDEYQILEAKSLGADAVLLIAAVLSPAEVKQLATLADSLGMQSILEVHSGDEVETHLCPEVQLVGVNNRDLKSFKVDIETSFRLASRIPNIFVKISESGISSADALRRLREAGYSGFLIGEAFMADSNPQMACRKLVDAIGASV